MQIINQALSPEALAAFRKALEGQPQKTAEDRAGELDRKMRARHERAEEQADRNRHERRKAAALARGV